MFQRICRKKEVYVSHNWTINFFCTWHRWGIVRKTKIRRKNIARNLMINYRRAESFLWLKSRKGNINTQYTLHVTTSNFKTAFSSKLQPMLLHIPHKKAIVLKTVTRMIKLEWFVTCINSYGDGTHGSNCYHQFIFVTFWQINKTFIRSTGLLCIVSTFVILWKIKYLFKKIKIIQTKELPS